MMKQAEEIQRFTVLLEKDENSVATGFSPPFSVPEVFGTRGRVPVRGTINGYPFRSSLMPMCGRHIMAVNAELRAGADVKGGEMVEIVLERDTAPRTVEVPDDLAAALAENPVAQAVWNRLSYTHRKENVRALADAKKPETRVRRLKMIIDVLVAAQK